jgi:hypothetical protein
MGLDMTAHIHCDNQHFASVDIPRRYSFFHTLAGVRNGELEQMFPLRGLPDKIPYETEVDFEEYVENASGISWLKTNEFEQVYSLWSKKDFHNYIIEVESVIAAMKVLENDFPDNVIIVFWFS